MKATTFWKSPGNWVSAFGAFIIVGMWIFIITTIREDRRIEISHAAQHTGNMSLVLQRHISDTLLQVKSSLLSLRRNWESGISTKEMYALLDHFVSSRSDLFNLISLIDADGEVLVTNQKTFKTTYSGDRTFFIYHQNNPGHAMHIEGPIMGRVTGKWYLPVSIRLQNDKGEFAGVLLASLNPYYFSMIFQEVNLGQRSLIYMADQNGIIYSGMSGGKELKLDITMPKNQVSAIFNRQTPASGVEISFLDGVERICSRSFIRGQSMFVSVDTALSEKLESFNSRARYLVVIQTLLTIFLTVVLLRLRQAIELRETVNRELKLQKDRLAYILQTTNAGTWEWNVQTGEVMLNERYAEIIGYTLEELAPHSSETWIKYTHPEDVQATSKLLEEHFSGKLDYYEIEIRMKHKSGHWVWILDRGKIISWTQEGKPLWVYGTHQEITERKVAQEERVKLQKLESVSTLAGGIAHDFNNLLMAIFGNITLTRLKLPQDHPAVQFLNETEKAMDRATRLTHQLLTFARGGAPVRKITDIGELIKEAVFFDLSGRNVLPVIEYPENLWHANVDKGQVQQAVSNLVINAAQAMPFGGNLFVKLENLVVNNGEKTKVIPGKYIKLTFRDEGIGIDPQYIGQIFDPYFTTKQSGSGLGLATTHSIINRHDGYIEVESEPGKGTIFTLYIPATVPHKVSETAQYSQAKKPEAESARILVMDDDKGICTLLAEFLQNQGYSADIVSNGEEAIKIYKQEFTTENSFDAVIMDLTIPGGMGGKEAVKGILEIDPNARCIVSSGYASDPIMSQYADYGFKGVAEKPYSLSKLIDLLQQVLKD